jgi:hypothetical protein
MEIKKLVERTKKNKEKKTRTGATVSLECARGV